MVRGTVNLPHGTGKTARVVVIAAGPKAAEAEAAGADYVGSDELIRKDRWRLDRLRRSGCNPDMMGKVGCLQDPGPRNLMPNPQDRYRDHGCRKGCCRHQGR